MRGLQRLGVWGLGAALLLGGTAAASGDDGPAPAKSSGSSVWSGHLFGSGSSKKTDKADADKVPPNTVTPAHAPSRDEAAAVRAREEDALLRRMAVCDKLKQIAERTEDRRLEELADQLEQRAKNLYFQRIANLPASKATPDLDEFVLDKHQEQSGVEALPSSPLPHRVPGADGRRAAAPQEDKP